MNEKNRESALRRALRKNGCMLHKSRANINPDNLGGFQIVDIGMNAVIAGSRFDLDLDDVAEYAQRIS